MATYTMSVDRSNYWKECMHKRLALSVIAFGLLSAWGDVYACGDKLMMLGRGLRFKTAYASLHPGNIVFYLPRTSRAEATAAVDKMQKFLAGAGHRVTIARDPAALDDALRVPAVSLVLADSSEAPRLQSRVSALPARPGLVALVHTKQAAGSDTALQREFEATIRSFDKPKEYLPMVEKLMKTMADRRRRQ